MQIKKEALEKSILQNAKEEFIQNGFQKTSLRTIARKSNISHSNIYHYFKDKNDLYKAVLQPVLSGIEQALVFLQTHESNENHTDLNGHLKLLNAPVEFMDKNRDLLNLLVFKSSGSCLEGYKDILVDRLTYSYYAMLESISRRHKLPELKFSEFFFHNMASIWVNYAVESLMHNVSKEEALATGKDLMTFIYCGWSGLVQDKCGSLP